MCACTVASVMSDFVLPYGLACQAPLSMGFSRKEYWHGFLCLPPGDLPDPRIKLASLLSPALADGLFTTSATWEAPTCMPKCINICPHIFTCPHIYIYVHTSMGFSGGKESACQCRRHGFSLWVGRIPWRRKWQPTPVL